MNQIKRFLQIFLTIWAVFLALFIPLSFIMTPNIISVLDKFLHLRVHPGFNGGEIRQVIYDRMGDDSGAGSLVYPKHSSFQGGNYLDLVKYTVFEPIINAPWSPEKDIWQLGLTFADMSNSFETFYDFSHPIIHIYIDIDGVEGGSLETAEPRAELVRFSPQHPWDLMIEVSGWNEHALLISSDGEIRQLIPVYFAAHQNSVYVRILLNHKKIKAVLDGRPTYHYVLVGAYSPYDKGHFMRVTSRGGIQTGGGADSRLTPKIYDYLTPSDYSQEDILSSYDEDSYEYATLIPVTVSTNKEESGSGSYAKAQEYLKKMKEIRAEQTEESRQLMQEELTKLKKQNAEANRIAIIYFNLGEINRAETLFEEYLQAHPDDPVSLAYYGSIISMKAAEASISDAVKYVNQAYGYLDSAVEKSDPESEEILHASLNRANVSMNVPEEVFQKSLTGASDFIRAAEYLEKNSPEDTVQIADCYCNAGICLEKAAQHEKAQIAFLKAASFEEISYRVKYELAKRGLIQ